MSLDVGVLAQADSGRFDPARMRAERQARVLVGMADEGIDALLVGTGANLRPLPRETREKLKAAGISADPMSTGAAVRTFNILLAEERAVAAALIAVEG